MIAQIEGQLVSLDQDKCLVQVGSVCYEVMLPGYAVSGLSGQVGTDVTLCTIEYYEGTPGGGNLIPRMVGFLTHGEKEFFRLYTSVKGMGTKKGLKSLTMPIARIADAIESGDEKMLTALPAIGKRFAQLIIAKQYREYERLERQSQALRNSDRNRRTNHRGGVVGYDVGHDAHHQHQATQHDP